MKINKINFRKSGGNLLFNECHISLDLRKNHEVFC
jgi:hypothetical protein